MIVMTGISYPIFIIFATVLERYILKMQVTKFISASMKKKVSVLIFNPKKSQYCKY